MCKNYLTQFGNLLVWALLVFSTGGNTQGKLRPENLSEIKKTGQWLRMREFFVNSPETQTVLMLCMVYFVGFCHTYQNQLDIFFQILLAAYFIILVGLIRIASLNVEKVLSHNPLATPLITPAPPEQQSQPTSIILPVPHRPPRLLSAAFA